MSPWLYIAFGISAALLILGVYAIVITQAELASGQRKITMIGETVCLPHKKPWFGLFGGAETDECYFGFLGENGSYYGISDKELDNKFWSNSQRGDRLLISGAITLPPEAFPSTQTPQMYDIDGMIVVTSVTSLPP
jgi:hypothetical protein